MTIFASKPSRSIVTLRFPHPGTQLNTPNNNPYYQQANIDHKLPLKNYNPVEWEGYFDQILYLEGVDVC